MSIPDGDKWRADGVTAPDGHWRGERVRLRARSCKKRGPATLRLPAL